MHVGEQLPAIGKEGFLHESGRGRDVAVETRQLQCTRVVSDPGFRQIFLLGRAVGRTPFALCLLDAGGERLYRHAPQMCNGFDGAFARITDDVQ